MAGQERSGAYLNTMKQLEPILHKKKFQELTTDELYELLRVRCEVFVV